MFRKLMVAIMVSMVALASGWDDIGQMSENTEVFAGVEVDGSTIQGDIDKSTDSSYVADHKSKNISVGLRLGAQNMQWRSMLLFDYFKKNTQTYKRGIVQADYFILSNTSMTTSFRPYIGVNGGYMNYEGGTSSESGFVYGGQVGFVTAVGQNIDLDIAYRYDISNLDSLDHIENILVGFNYIY